MKKVFKSVACVLAATALSANVFAADDTELAEMGIVRGRVVDTENHTLPGASIFIEDLHTGVVSDIDGFYILPTQAVKLLRKILYLMKVLNCRK